MTKGIKNKFQALRDEEELAKIYKVPKEQSLLIRNAIEAVFRKDA